MNGHHRIGFRLLSCSVVLAAVFACTAFAAEQAPPPKQSAPAVQSEDSGTGTAEAEVRKASMRVRELQQRLERIRNQALENDSALQAQQQALQQKVNERMQARGVDLQADLERLREIATRLRSDDLTEAEQQALADEYRGKRQELLQARNAVLNEKQIQEGREQFGRALLGAMKKVEPEVEQIIDRYGMAQAEFRRKLAAARQEAADG